MREKDATELQRENLQPREQAERDWFTGLYNRGAVEKKIDKAMETAETAALFVIDVDRFKVINDLCGHLLGDEVLKEIAQILRRMFYGGSLAGRVGGDEFVAFLPEDSDWQTIENRLAELSYSLARAGRAMNLPEELTVTVGVSRGRRGERYASIFRRANEMLLEEKQRKKTARRLMEDRKPAEEGSVVVSIEKDMELISRELRESGEVMGACCQDYNTFKHIFRFVARGLKRSGQRAYVILLTLTDLEGQLPPLAGRMEHMLRLKDVISRSLRIGDVFTQYSSGQFLLMVLGASEENAAMIGDRISIAFYEKLPEGTRLRLCRELYPLMAVGY